MAHTLIKRGNADNVSTPVYFCDRFSDRANIDPKDIFLGTICVILEGESGELEFYIANSDKEWKLFQTTSSSTPSPEPEPELEPIDINTLINKISENDEAEITLTEPLTLVDTINIPAGKSIYIDLNGQDITTNTTLFNVNGGTLVLSGEGNVNAGGNIVLASNGGKAIIKGGTYDSTASNFGMGAIGPGSTIEFNDGDLSTTEGGIMAFDGGTIFFNGGTIHTRDNFAIATNGSTGRGGNTIVMNGGEIDAHITSNGYEAIGIYLPNDDIFIMNGGTIVAHDGAGIVQRGGSCAIHGGSITATGAAGTTGYVGDNKTKMSKSAIIYHQTANYPAVDTIRLNITGGTFTGVDHSLEILSNETTPKVTVTGGTFNPTRD